MPAVAAAVATRWIEGKHAWVGGQGGPGLGTGAVEAEDFGAEVVGADGEEVDRGGEGRGGRGGRGDLDHDAELGWFLAGLGGGLGEGGADGGHLVQRGDHRYQHGQPGTAAPARTIARSWSRSACGALRSAVSPCSWSRRNGGPCRRRSRAGGPRRAFARSWLRMGVSWAR